MINRFEDFLVEHGELTADLAVAAAAIATCAGLLPGLMLAFIFIYAFIRVYGGLYDRTED